MKEATPHLMAEDTVSPTEDEQEVERSLSGSGP
jgi:hypothetical protein